MTKPLLDQLFSLDDRIYVITGGGGILAGTMANAIAQCGGKLALLDLKAEEAEKNADEINQAGGTAIAIQTDVLNREALDNACDEVIKTYGKIDGLINGAGGNKPQATTSETLSFFDMPEDAGRWVMDLNFMGTMLPCQVFGREIVKQSQGVFLNIASIAGFRPLTLASTYAAAKSAVINFTSWLAVHMCQNYSTKIRVNAIAPGFCITKQNRYLLLEKDGSLTPRSQTVMKAVPQKRFGEPHELIGGAIWLLSDAASFVTGSVVTIDGGFDAYGGV